METTPLKILADGTEIPATDPRTDHVAVLFPDTGWMVACDALTNREGEAHATADDVDAEADRLEKLGAKKIAFVKRWWVMEAPTGQRFCVVRTKFPDRGVAWNDWD